MSTYVTRFVEIKVKDITGKVSTFADLDSVQKEEGSIYHVVNGSKNGDYKCVNGEWTKIKDVPYKWILAKHNVNTKYNLWRTDKEEDVQDGWCDNGGAIKSSYLNRTFGEASLADRWFPEDMSQELKDKFADGSELQYTWGHTYVTLEEWSNVLIKEKDKWKQSIIDLFTKKREDKLNEKLDYIISSLITKTTEEKKEDTTDDEYDEFEDDFSYITDDKFWDLCTLNAEIEKANLLAEGLIGYSLSTEDIRIIYYFS